MAKRSVCWSAGWMAWLVAMALGPVGALAGRPDHVFLVSIDGLRSDLLDRAPTPNLDLAIKAGARALAARTIVPAVTLPAHASMLTGVGPSRHGVLFNGSVEGRPPMAQENLLSMVAGGGGRAAAWLGKKKLLHLVPPRAGVDVRHAGFTARRVLDHALPSLSGKVPDLVFLHLPDVDSAGHEHGWGSPEQLAAVAEVDRQIGRMWREVHRLGLLRKSAFLFLADHGGHGKAHGLHHPEEFQIEWVAAGIGIQPGRTIEAPVSVLDTVPTVLALLGREIPAGLEGRVVAEALFHEEESDRAAVEGPTRLGALLLGAGEPPSHPPGPAPAPAPAPAPVRRVLEPLIPPVGRIAELWGSTPGGVPGA